MSRSYRCPDRIKNSTRNKKQASGPIKILNVLGIQTSTALAAKISSGDIPNSMRCSFQCSHHPRSPRRTSWNVGGTLVEPSWNLTSGPPRTTPEPIWAETPKLSAVGEKHVKTNKMRRTNTSTQDCKVPTQDYNFPQTDSFLHVSCSKTAHNQTHRGLSRVLQQYQMKWKLK